MSLLCVHGRFKHRASNCLANTLQMLVVSPCYCAVYMPGHGGPNAADYVRTNLFINLLEHTKFTTDIVSALGEHQHIHAGNSNPAVTHCLALYIRTSAAAQESNSPAGPDLLTVKTLTFLSPDVVSMLFLVGCCKSDPVGPCYVLCVRAVESFEHTDTEYLKQNDNASRDDG